MPVSPSTDCSNLTLPVELFQNILQALPQGKLYAICTLSRTFHKEAIYALYRHIDLAHRQTDLIISWAQQIIKRHDIAQLVFALSLPHDFGQITLERRDLVKARLAAAMRDLPNLTSLVIELRMVGHAGAFRTQYLDGRMFIGSPFRLKTFRNIPQAEWEPDSMLPFLLEQDQIEDLEMGNSTHLAISVAETQALDLLPHLTTLSIPLKPTNTALPLFRIMVLRPLVRLKIFMPSNFTPDDYRSVVTIIGHARETLTHLCLFTSNVDVLGESLHVKMIENIAHHLPNLEFLQYYRTIPLGALGNGCGPALQMTPCGIALPRALSALNGLRTVSIAVRDEGSIEIQRDDARALAVRSMALCPNLRRVITMNTRYPHNCFSFAATPESDMVTDFCEDMKARMLMAWAWRDS